MARATAVWRRRLDDTFEFLNLVQKSSTQQEICRHLLCYAKRLGATNLLAGPIPPPRALKREQVSHVLLDAWPEEWSERYFSNGYLYRDPTIRLVNRGSSPFHWTRSTKCAGYPLTASGSWTRRPNLDYAKGSQYRL
ncbi:MAG: hypothetical protein E5W82_34410 [Mesorhizobium sp.]|nr:MAG: hypothetical protein E5W82_34410 [Mesorhizobium sp.]